MVYEAYNAYLSVAPSNVGDLYKDDFQALIDDQFENASDYYTIQEELTKGTKTFTDISVRINQVIDPKTGQTLGDDYKKIIFQQLEHQTGLGYRYQFDNNTWIATNTDLYKSVTASVIIRRCNNVLRWKQSGEIFEEPCVIDYNISRTRFDYNSDIILPEANIKFLCQYNNNSKNIVINQRFLFNGQAFKVDSVDNRQNQSTYNSESVTLIYFTAIKDTVNTAYDNLELNIADYYRDETSNGGQTSATDIVVSPTVDLLLQGEEQVFTAYLVVNNVQQNDVVVVSASGVPNSYYQMVILSDNSFKIKNVQMYSEAPLIVNLSAGSINKNMSIFLKGLW